MLESRTEAIVRSLLPLEGITRQDAHLLAQLDVSIYTCMVLARLRQATLLLGRDETFSERQRRETWQAWFEGATAALNGALRYREREDLVLAIAILADLIPGLHPQAKTISYRHVMDKLKYNGLRRSILKQERRRRKIRLEEIVMPSPLWVTPTGEVYPGRLADEATQQHYKQRSYLLMWGVEFHHHLYDWRAVLQLVRAVLPIITHREGETTYIAPLPIW